MNKKLLVLLLFSFLAFGGVYFYLPKNNLAEKNEIKIIKPKQKSIQTHLTDVNKISNKQIEKIGSEPGVCLGSDTNNFDCYETYYKNIVETKGIAQAFADLKIQYPKNAYVQSQCHPLTHVIGRAGAEKYSKVSEAYTQGDPFCWSGYYHGVMEGVVGKYGRKEFPNVIASICSSIPGKEKYNFDYYNCVHGLGHGVMVYNNNEMFEALEMCDNLNGGWEQTSCYSGVFMENVIIDNKNHFTKFLKKDDLLYPCNVVKTKYKSPCYLMQTSYMLKLTGGDFKPVYETCEKADEGFVNTCYQSLGRDASGRSSSSVPETVKICNLGKDYDQKSNCIVGAVKDFISYFHSDQQAGKLCAEFSDDLEKICTQTKIEYYKTLAK